MSKLTMTKHVEAPADAVFAVASDFPNAASHISGISKVDMLTDGPVGIGTRFRETRKMFGKEATEEMEVTAYEPDRTYTLTAESCGCRYLSTFRLEPAGNGTDVHFDFDATPLSTFAKATSFLMSALMGRTLRKCLESDLNDLKSTVEKRANGQA